MRILFTLFVLIFGLMTFWSSIAFSGTNTRPDINKTTPRTIEKPSPSGISSSDKNTTSIASSLSETPKDKELVVVSKTPEFFTYTLSTISVLLSVITILVAIITGVGLTVVIRASRDKKELEGIRASFDREQKETRENLKRDYEKMIEALQQTAFGLATFQRAKHNLRETLSMPDPSPKDVHLLIQKTVRYPDAECLKLYAKALLMFETNVDIVRVVRNGILEFSRKQ